MDYDLATKFEEIFPNTTSFLKINTNTKTRPIIFAESKVIDDEHEKMATIVTYRKKFVVYLFPSSFQWFG